MSQGHIKFTSSENLDALQKIEGLTWEQFQSILEAIHSYTLCGGVYASEEAASFAAGTVLQKTRHRKFFSLPIGP